MNNEVVIPVSDLKPFTVTVRVSGLGLFKARLWVARYLFLFAAFVAGCVLRIEVDV